MSSLPYDPGAVPTAPAPAKGERLVIEVAGLPPYKEMRQSIRNTQHPRYGSFVALRRAATQAMAGRAWYFGPIGIELTLYAPRLHKGCSAMDYMAGTMDTLDGSSGPTFTYLPIVYQDDCQVAKTMVRCEGARQERYRLVVEFL